MLSSALSLLFLGHLITTHEYNEMINCPETCLSLWLYPACLMSYIAIFSWLLSAVDILLIVISCEHSE